MCTCIFQPRWIFHWRGYRGGITHLLTFKEISSQEGHLDFQNEKRVVSYVLSGQSLASPSYCYGISVHREQIPPTLPGAHLSPASDPDQQAASVILFTLSPNDVADTILGVVTFRLALPLALALYLCKDQIMSCCGCWPSTPPERSSRWRAGNKLLWALGRLPEQVFRYGQIFRRRFYEPDSSISSNLEKH